MSGVHFQIRYDRWCGWLLGLLGLGRRFSAVVVADGAVSVRMGWAFTSHIPTASIVSAVADDDAGVWGWGVHGWRRRWLVNGSSSGLVRIDIDPPARAHIGFVPVQLAVLRVGVEEPDVLIDALRSTRG